MEAHSGVVQANPGVVGGFFRVAGSLPSNQVMSTTTLHQPFCTQHFVKAITFLSVGESLKILSKCWQGLSWLCSISKACFFNVGGGNITILNWL